LLIFSEIGNPHTGAFDFYRMQSICIIIPCYNESQRIDFAPFREFIREKQGVTFCFVNDGSKDNTLELLQNFEKEFPERVMAISLEKNCGKAEAIRYGVNTVSESGFVGLRD